MMTRRVAVAAVLSVLTMSSFAISGCSEEGPMEEAGEKADEAVEDTKRGVDDATD